MNQRIQELADQMFGMEEFEYAEEFLNDAFMEKFAELIVKECIDIAYREGDNVAYLALHFGVEE